MPSYDGGGSIGERAQLCDVEPLCRAATCRARLPTWRLAAGHLPPHGDPGDQRDQAGRRLRGGRGGDDHVAAGARSSRADGGGAGKKCRQKKKELGKDWDKLQESKSSTLDKQL